MKAEILRLEQIPEASALANEVITTSLRMSMMPNMVPMVYGYVTTENLTQMVTSGRLVLFGIYEYGCLAAVGGLQTEGHISILYVKLPFMRRGCGRTLLLEMERYAALHLGRKTITLNALPVWTKSYFTGLGYKDLDPYQPIGAPFAPMSKTIEDADMLFERKPFRARNLLITLAATAGAVLVAGLIFSLKFYLG